MMIQPLSRLGMEAWTSTRGAGSPARPHSAESTTQSAGSTGQTNGSGEESFTATAETPTSSLANKQTFLTLLVAQIKNQNPLNPADGTEFLSQLAQFSELEQLISIREEVEALNKAGAQTAAPDAAS
jgi:flagellar basal-body rod modification protein FlgD